MHFEVKFETFALMEDQHHNLWAALARAGELTDGKLPKSALLDLICTDFLMTNSWGKRGAKDHLAKWLHRIETVLDRRLVLVNTKTKRVEYGYDALEAIAVDE